MSKQRKSVQIESQFLPAEQAATFLGISTRKLWELVKDPSDPIPCHRYSRKLIRFYWPDLLEWAGRRREDTSAVDRIVSEVLGK